MAWRTFSKASSDEEQMMRRRVVAFLACACLLVAPSAFADDGGWLDWLFRMDPTFVGVATDFHIYCANGDGQKLDNCEELFGIPYLFGRKFEDRVDYSKIRHELNLRFAWYHTKGELYPADPGDSAKAIKLMLFYAYHPDPGSHFVISAGAGVLPFYGGNTKETRWSGIITPLHIRYFPAGFSSSLTKSSLFFQMESSYITRIPTPDLFANYPPPVPAPTHLGEWNVSIAVGVDYRRWRTR
jgi:hypothetical protein